MSGLEPQLLPYPPGAEVERFDWLTRNAYVAGREARLLARLPRVPGPWLEIGAGEGSNLYHLGPVAAYALDCSPEKLRFGRSRVAAAGWVAGDALALPFADGVFTAVLLRDVLHHVGDRRQTLAEAARVVRPGGLVTVLEANGATLLARVFACLNRHERGLVHSRFDHVCGEATATAGLVLEHAELVEPAPAYRLLFHHRVGLPSLAASPLAVHAAELVERVWTQLGGAGSYILVVARREASIRTA